MLADMKEKLLALMPDHQSLLRLEKLQRLHFCATGDETVFTLPPAIILGQSRKPAFDRRRISMETVIDPAGIISSSYGYLIPASDQLSSLQQELCTDWDRPGFYISSAVRPVFAGQEPFSCRTFSLVMLKATADGYTLLQ